MDSRKAVRTYRRNLAIVLGIILLIFLLIPVTVKSPYVLIFFVLVFYMSALSCGSTTAPRTCWAA